MRVRHLRIAIIATLAFVACATSGESRLPQSARTGSTIFVSKHYSGYEARHIGEVVRTFEKYGFVATHDRASSHYYLDYSINAGAVVTVKIALLRDRQPVVEVSSTNIGWGTVIARPIAISSRVSSALERLDALLSEGR